MKRHFEFGILVFDSAEELDFVGPWDVFTVAAGAASADKVALVAQHANPIRCEKGMRVLPDCTFSDVSSLEVLLIPGGSGARRQLENVATIDWLLRIAPQCRFLTSVCTGSFLLAGSGLAFGKTVTTHHDYVEHLRRIGGVSVVSGVRFVPDGNVVTAAGVISGIEMSLWLVETLYSRERRRFVENYIAYELPPKDRSVLENSIRQSTEGGRR